MSETDRLHDLLPWYLADSLTAEEAAVFRKHLASCTGCQQEMTVFEELRAAVDEHGEALFSEHPSAERLVAALRGEAGENETAAVRRHLAVCASCATESRWVLGDVTAVARERRRAPPRGQANPFSGPQPGFFLVPVERSAGDVPRIPLPTDRRPLVVMLEAAVEETAFPLAIEITAADGRVAFSGSATHSDRTAGAYVLLILDPADFAPGGYAARLFAEAADTPSVESRFEIVGPLATEAD